MIYDAEIYNSVLDRVETILNEARDAIRAEMAAKDINATGNTSKSFRVERYDGGIRLVMGGESFPTAPLETLEVGRPGGNVPGGFRMTKAGVRDVSNTFKAILVDWARDKGIVGFGWGAATLLGRRIASEGTLRNKAPKVVYTEAVIEARDEIMRTATVTVTDKIHEELLKLI
jgi:hypothetical protein